MEREVKKEIEWFYFIKTYVAIYVKKFPVLNFICYQVKNRMRFVSVNYLGF